MNMPFRASIVGLFLAATNLVAAPNFYQKGVIHGKKIITQVQGGTYTKPEKITMADYKIDDDMRAAADIVRTYSQTSDSFQGALKDVQSFCRGFINSLAGYTPASSDQGATASIIKAHRTLAQAIIDAKTKEQALTARADLRAEQRFYEIGLALGTHISQFLGSMQEGGSPVMAFPTDKVSPEDMKLLAATHRLIFDEDTKDTAAAQEAFANAQQLYAGLKAGLATYKHNTATSSFARNKDKAITQLISVANVVTKASSVGDIPSDLLANMSIPDLVYPEPTDLYQAGHTYAEAFTARLDKYGDSLCDITMPAHTRLEHQAAVKAALELITTKGPQHALCQQACVQLHHMFEGVRDGLIELNKDLCNAEDLAKTQVSGVAQARCILFKDALRKALSITCIDPRDTAQLQQALLQELPAPVERHYELGNAFGKILVSTDKRNHYALRPSVPGLFAAQAIFREKDETHPCSVEARAQLTDYAEGIGDALKSYIPGSHQDDAYKNVTIAYWQAFANSFDRAHSKEQIMYAQRQAEATYRDEIQRLEPQFAKIDDFTVDTAHTSYQQGHELAQEICAILANQSQDDSENNFQKVEHLMNSVEQFDLTEENREETTRDLLQYLHGLQAGLEAFDMTQATNTLTQDLQMQAVQQHTFLTSAIGSVINQLLPSPGDSSPSAA